MSQRLVVLSLVCLCVATCKAQFGSNFLLGAYLGEDFLESFGENQGALYGLNQISRRLTALETNVRTGAVGGCESGVIGPLTQAQRMAQIQFLSRFLTPPAVSLSVSDVTEANAATVLSFQIRPGMVTTTGASVVLTDNTNSVGSLLVTYMACPSNSATAVVA